MLKVQIVRYIEVNVTLSGCVVFESLPRNCYIPLRIGALYICCSITGIFSLLLETMLCTKSFSPVEAGAVTLSWVTLKCLFCFDSFVPIANLFSIMLIAGIKSL